MRKSALQKMVLLRAFPTEFGVRAVFPGFFVLTNCPVELSHISYFNFYSCNINR